MQPHPELKVAYEDFVELYEEARRSPDGRHFVVPAVHRAAKDCANTLQSLNNMMIQHLDWVTTREKPLEEHQVPIYDPDVFR